MPLSVFPTKLYAPRAPAAINRSRLENSAPFMQKRLTLISAPAGFGKTTLVSKILESHRAPAAWLSLDENDAEPLRFLAGIIAALSKTLPGSLTATSAILTSGQPTVDSVLTALLQELSALTLPLTLPLTSPENTASASLPEAIIIILDDYHRLDSQPVDDAFAFLLEHLPSHIHWVVTTREDPSLPLARMRVRGELAEIRADDLRFTPEEADEFLRSTLANELSDSQIEALESKTEGWIAGLQLAALSLQNSPDRDGFIQSFTGSHRFIIDYLAEEVLNAQSDEIQQFLLKTSVTSRFNASLCAALTGNSDSANVLRDIESQNLFLIALDEERNWYRYHHLFADVLRSHAQQSDIDTASLHSTASQWFQSHGDIHTAIHHALSGNDNERAAEYIAESWPTLRKSEPEAIFIQWVRSLPESVASKHPVIATYYSLALISYDPHAAQQWLSYADTAVDNSQKDSALAGILSICRAYTAGAQGDFPGIITHADNALAILPDTELTWRGAAAILKGFVLWGSGDIEGAALTVQAGYDAMRRDNEISGAVSSVFLLASIRMMQGQTPEAERLCERALKMIEPYPLAPQGSSDIYVTLSVAALRRGDNTDAEQRLYEAQALGEQSRLMESAHHWYIVKAIIESRKGNFRDALDLLDEAESIRVPNPTPEFEPMDARRARLELAAGNLPAAQHWVNNAGVSLNDAPHVMNAFSLLTLAQIEIHNAVHKQNTERLNDIRRLLTKIRTLEENTRPGMLPEILILSAYVAHLEGDSELAIQELATAINLPAAEQNAAVFIYDMPLVNQWVLEAIQPGNNQTRTSQARTSQAIDIPPWLKLSAPEDKAPEDKAPEKLSSPTQIPTRQPLPEPLSERELDVLRALDSDMTGPEIAASLFVSLNTIRTHSKNIYSKLNVNTRRAALRRAKELALV